MSRTRIVDQVRTTAASGIGGALSVLAIVLLVRLNPARAVRRAATRA